MTRLARALQLLELEPRDVPAGNVTITQLGTELRVIGDAEVNSFTIVGKDPGVVEISGAGTTINGGTAKVTASGVEWLRATGRENDDVIKTLNLNITRVDLFGEGGNDVLDVSGGTGDILYALGGNGDDTIRTHGLAIGQVNVYGEAGTDLLDVTGCIEGSLPGTDFTNTGLLISVNGGSGDDSIRVANTRTRGDFCGIFISGDEGRNSITVSNTDIAPSGPYGGFLYLSIDGGYGTGPGAGQQITIDGMKQKCVVPDTEPGWGWLSWQVYIGGGEADDAIKLRNFDLSATGNNTFLDGDFFVWGSDGFDRIDVDHSSWKISVTPGIGASSQVMNSFDAEQVSLRNIRQEGGAFDGEGFSGSLLYVSAVEADLRNVAVTSVTGFTNLGLSSPWDAGAAETSFTLANVTVHSGSGLEETDLYTADGNDSVRVTNSELGFVNIYLGEGDDTLMFVNVDFTAHFVYPNGYESYGGINAGGGNDTVSLTKCTGESLILTMGDGDDTVSLKNNTFGTAYLFGGDGSDELDLLNNSGLFNIDGFES